MKYPKRTISGLLTLAFVLLVIATGLLACSWGLFVWHGAAAYKTSTIVHLGALTLATAGVWGVLIWFARNV